MASATNPPAPPASGNQRDLRAALGQFATGVTVMLMTCVLALPASSVIVTVKLSAPL